MKVLKILKTVFLACSAVLFIFSFVLCGAMAAYPVAYPAEASYFTILSALISVCVWALVGIFLLSATNGIAQNFGIFCRFNGVAFQHKIFKLCDNNACIGYIVGVLLSLYIDICYNKAQFSHGV